MNTPPIPDSIPCIAITEGTGTIQHLLTYTDAQNDTVEYNITSVVFIQNTNEYMYNTTPTVNVSIVAGVLYVTPPDGISGNLTVNYTLTETGNYFTIIFIVILQ